MFDAVSVTKMSEQQLQDALQSIERKMGGISPANQAAFDLMLYYKDTIINELQERRMMDSLKIPPLPPMNLTDDELSRKEKADEEQARKQNDQ